MKKRSAFTGMVICIAVGIVCLVMQLLYMGEQDYTKYNKPAETESVNQLKDYYLQFASYYDVGITKIEYSSDYYDQYDIYIGSYDTKYKLAQFLGTVNSYIYLDDYDASIFFHLYNVGRSNKDWVYKTLELKWDDENYGRYLSLPEERFSDSFEIDEIYYDFDAETLSDYLSFLDKTTKEFSEKSDHPLSKEYISVNEEYDVTGENIYKDADVYKYNSAREFYEAYKDQFESYDDAKAYYDMFKE